MSSAGWCGDLWLAQPEAPRALVHCLGGAFVGAAPQLIYASLIERLLGAGFAVAAVPYVTGPEHRRLAIASVDRLQQLPTSLLRLPRYGLGHSLGCKLHLIASCLEAQTLLALPPRQGNILLALSNAAPQAPLEFDPSPTALQAMVANTYTLKSTLVVRFADDTLDDSASLNLGGDLRALPGNHLTPCTADADALRMQRIVVAWLQRQSV